MGLPRAQPWDHVIVGDRVRHAATNGEVGEIVELRSPYALVRWSHGLASHPLVNLRLADDADDVPI
jgi:hypothetical protein